MQFNMKNIMKKEIEWWHESTEDWTEEDWATDWRGTGTCFNRYYFNSSARKKLEKVKEFIHNNNIRFCIGGHTNKELIKAKQNYDNDKKRMHAKLKELNIKYSECKVESPLCNRNMRGIISKVYFKGQEIIY